MLEDVLIKSMRGTRGTRIHKIGKDQNTLSVCSKRMKLRGFCLNIAKALKPANNAFLMPTIGEKFFSNRLFKIAF